MVTFGKDMGDIFTQGEEIVRGRSDRHGSESHRTSASRKSATEIKKNKCVIMLNP